MESNESYYSIKNSVDNVDLPFDWAFGEFNINLPNTEKKEDKENNKIKKDFVYVNNLVVNPNKKIVDSSPKWQKILEKNSLEKEQKNSYSTSKQKSTSNSNSNSKSSLNKQLVDSKLNKIELEPFDFP